MEHSAGPGGAETLGVEAMVEKLATWRGRGETVADLAHDARNMVTALGLYCDLLEEQGVLATPYLHYGSELRLVAAASRRLVEKLVAFHESEASGAGISHGALRSLGQSPGESKGVARLDRSRHWDSMPAIPIDNLAEELKASRNLLAALAGPSVVLTVDIEGGAKPVRLTGEDLTRVLVNLVKNSAEAMPTGGRIALGLHEFHAEPQEPPWLVLTVEDTGQGISQEALDAIFGAGYTTRASGSSVSGAWAGSHRGLGLSITRSIVEAAGGRIHAANPTAAGARLEIELPVGNR
jgi:signal transduction histidine kinase